LPLHYFYHQPFHLENGAVLSSLDIAYCTYGSLNAAGDNVVWVCHALTASAAVEEWWPGLVGQGCTIDPGKYFIVCANIPGSCYGTTGPLSINENSGAIYGHSFPLISIRDMVQAHILLRKHLGISSIALVVGGSMGGYQAMEWALHEPDVIMKMLLLATSATESPWGVAIHTAQRMAIEADTSWLTGTPQGGRNGLKAARAIGMLTYRNYDLFVLHQADPETEKLEHFKSSSYIHYQAEKLARRFNACSYHTLTRSMDTHNIARGRNSTVAQVLGRILQPVLVIGISSDILCPPAEQRFLADHIPNARYEEINSPFGHDGFLVEADKIGALLQHWLLQP
jgi:homoserine O-acetyltransferase